MAINSFISIDSSLQATCALVEEPIPPVVINDSALTSIADDQPECDEPLMTAVSMVLTPNRQLPGFFTLHSFNKVGQSAIEDVSCGCHCEILGSHTLPVLINSSLSGYTHPSTLSQHDIDDEAGHGDSEICDNNSNADANVFLRKSADILCTSNTSLTQLKPPIVGNVVFPQENAGNMSLNTDGFVFDSDICEGKASKNHFISPSQNSYALISNLKDNVEIGSFSFVSQAGSSNSDVIMSAIETKVSMTKIADGVQPGEAILMVENELDGKSSTVHQENAVLVGTPNGLMLSFGDQMQCVSLPVVSDDQQSTNHFLAFSGGAVSGNGLLGTVSERCQMDGGILHDDDDTAALYQPVGDELAEESHMLYSGELASVDQPKKKSRGWPKGRKRKMTPEVTGPRAPMTGYVIFAINRRKEIKRGNSTLPFTEVTKLLGHEWTNMDAERKQDFLHRAESDKQRYIAELKEFQKPELHHAAKSNATEDHLAASMEHNQQLDMELHCKVCGIYFSSLHNKREHLLGRLHLSAIMDHINKRTDKKQAEDGGQLASMLVQDVPGEPSHDSVAAEMCSDGCSHCQVEHCVDIGELIVDFFHKHAEQELEVVMLKQALSRDTETYWSMCKQIEHLNNYQTELKQEVKCLLEREADLTNRITHLKSALSVFGVEDL